MNLRSPLSPTSPNLHQNATDPDARWLVQKFGGMSVGKFAVKIARDVVLLCHNPSPTPLGGSYIDNHKVTVVCSARSGPKKALGTTNLLMDLGPREPYLFKGLCVKSVQYVGGTHMSALG